MTVQGTHDNFNELKYHFIFRRWLLSIKLGTRCMTADTIQHLFTFLNKDLSDGG